MAEEKSFSIPALIDAMKQAGFATRSDVEEIVGDQLETRGREIISEEISRRGLATKEDVREIVGEEITARRIATKEDVKGSVFEAVDAVLNGMEDMNKQNQLEHKRLQDENKQAITTMEAHIRDDINGLKAELSDTPSRAEHNNLKERVTILEKRH
jgi:hypothetical protein